MKRQSPVQINVAGVDFCDGCGSLKAVAVVEMSVGGLFSISRCKASKFASKTAVIGVQAPQWRDPKSGQWLPCLLMPPESKTAMSIEVLAAIDDGLWERRLVPSTYTEASER